MLQRSMGDDDLAILLLVACAFALLVAWWVSLGMWVP